MHITFSNLEHPGLFIQDIDTRTVCNTLRLKESLNQTETFKNCYLLVLLLLPGYWEKNKTLDKRKH